MITVFDISTGIEARFYYLNGMELNMESWLYPQVQDFISERFAKIAEDKERRELVEWLSKND